MRRLLFESLRLLSSAELADSILGDLEEIRQRRSRESGGLATIWFWRSAIGIVGHALWTSIRGGLETVGRTAGGTRGSGGDLRDAVRALSRRHGFSAAAILLLALGIGANTAVFSIVHAVILRPLPYERPDELVFLWNGLATSPDNRHRIFTGTHLQEIGRRQSTLTGWAAFKSWESGLDGDIDLLHEDGSERLRGIQVTPNFFELLGVRPALGRTFLAGDSDAQPVAMISHQLWRDRFGRDPAIIGRAVRIAGGRQPRSRPPCTIVGVLPESFHFTYPLETQIYLVQPWSRITPHRALEYGIVGRLKPGVGLPQVRAEMTAIQHDVMRSYGFPPEHLATALSREAVLVEPIADHVRAPVRQGLSTIAAVAALVLLIASVNVGLLLMSRTIDRSGELAVRAALGAGPRRIFRLLVVEGIVLAAIGGLAGTALAYLALPIAGVLLPAAIPRSEEIGLHTDVLAFAVAATVLTALACAIVPGAIAQRRDLLAAVRRTSTGATMDRPLAVIRMVVVGVQVSIVLMLLVAAGLLLHSFWRLQTVPLGFAADEVITFETRLLNPRYRDAARRAAFQQELVSRAQALNGVEAVATATSVPMRGVDFVEVIGPRDGRPRWGHARTVAPAYFDVMRIPLLRGRLFTDADDAGAPRVMVVSESYARAHFGTVDPLGRRLAYGKHDVEIVGIVGDVRYASVSRPAAQAFYLPTAQYPSELLCLLVRPTPGMQSSVAAALRELVRSIDPEQPIQHLTTIGTIVETSTADRRFYSFATGAFAAVALLLAVAGLFGVVSRSVTERRRELAIRVALGADRERVLRLVLMHGLLPVVLGCLTGVVAAHAGSRAIESLLFDVTRADPLAYGAAAALMLVVAAGACLVPAVRALRVSPMAVLRGD